MSVAVLCMLALGVLPVLTVAIAKWGVRLDNHRPRDWAGTLDGYRRRAYAAHQNGYEAFPFFAAAVLAAEIQQAPRGLLDTLALIVLAARLAYVGAYLADRAALRSVVWAIGWFGTIAIFLAPLSR